MPAHKLNGRGLYHGTNVAKNDMVIHQDHRGRWRVDKITSSGGNHISVTGPAAGHPTAEAAAVEARKAMHRLGTTGMLLIQDGDSYSVYDEHWNKNGRRTGILSDGTRVNVYHDDTGSGDPWTVVPHSMEWDQQARGDIRSMLGMSETAAGISEWSEGQEGRHLGRSVPWDAVPPEIKRHIEQRVVGETMVANTRRATELTVPPHAEPDDYVIGVTNRDSEISLFRVRSGPDLFEIECSADLSAIARAAEIDARNRGTGDAVVWEYDDGRFRQAGHVLHGRWQVEMRPNGSSVYHDLKEAGLPLDNHESDLYVKDSPEARAILAKHGQKYSAFMSQIDNKRWLEVPFGYLPFFGHTPNARGATPGKIRQDLEASYYFNERKIADAEEELRRPGISSEYKRQMLDLIESARSDMEYAGRGMKPNARGTTADANAVRELSLYIENDYDLIGKPTSKGKSIDENLRKKVAAGKYDPKLAPTLWGYLIEDGARKYAKEYATPGDWAQMFNAATRKQVAEDFARAWEAENLR